MMRRYAGVACCSSVVGGAQQVEGEAVGGSARQCWVPAAVFGKQLQKQRMSDPRVQVEPMPHRVWRDHL